jgi:multimeric flavodoxin WrbA
MEKKIVAVNASPRKGWNTDTLVTEAAKGAQACGASIEKFDLYRLEKFTGCISCFGCKRKGHEGQCIYRDGLTPVLDAIRGADGLIIGTPNYLGETTAAFRALYERLIFQVLTYRTEQPNCSTRSIPVLFIMTSNASEEDYSFTGYDQMLIRYQNTFNAFIGPTQVLISGNTMQVPDYGKYDWTYFDTKGKIERHEKIFPLEKEKTFELGKKLFT